MRIYDPRIGKFLSVDPLVKDYSELSPYQFSSNTPIAAIDLDGEEAKVVVTNQITGYTKVHVYGANNVHEVTVRTYKAIIKYTDKTGKTSVIGTFNVTRDGWYGIGTDKNKMAILHNRSSDPKGKGTYSIVNRHAQQYGKETPSYTISPIYSPLPKEYNSTFIEEGKPGDKLDPEVKRNGNYAQGAEFHVGGYFITVDGNGKFSGTYGCYSIIDDSQVKPSPAAAQKKAPTNVTPSNDKMKEFGKKLNEAEQKQKEEFGKKKSTQIEIQKRNYDQIKKTTNQQSTN